MSAALRTRRGPHSPLGYLGARKARNQKLKFGIKKFYPKPRTEEDWLVQHEANRLPTANIASIRLTWATKGAGHTGIRHFSYFSVPTIKFFDGDIEIDIIKLTTKNENPSISIKTKDGKVVDKNVSGQTNEQIREWFKLHFGTKEESKKEETLAPKE